LFAGALRNEQGNFRDLDRQRFGGENKSLLRSGKKVRAQVDSKPMKKQKMRDQETEVTRKRGEAALGRHSQF